MKLSLKLRRPAGRASVHGTGALRAGLACLVMTSLSLNALTAAPRVTVVAELPTAPPNAHYVGHRSPLLPAPLLKLPVGTVRPEGWLHRVLRLQADGFHGHLTEISEFLKKENNAWLSPTGRGERGWEEVPYWLKGFQDCGYLLEDERMIREARVWIEGALGSQQPDGWFGPGEERTGVATDLKGRDDLWPNMIMLFCLQSYHERTGDPRVLTLMTRYFQYLAAVPEERFLLGYWPKMRAGDQLYSILWLYNRTGEPWLLDLAHKTHRHAARWDTGLINWHNVNLAQGFREPATYWVLSHDPRHRHATEHNWTELRALYGQVPGGMYGSDENCRPGFTGPRQAIETCGIAEEMLSDEILLGLTGDLRWADRCENVAFNSLPAAMTADLKALRYLTAPNQPQSDHVSKAPGIQNGGPMYCMDPHDHRCCQHNAGHAWPYFTQHLWMATAGNGLAAVLYAPSRVTAKVGDGTEVTFHTETRYPFDETLTFKLSAPRAVAFPLYLRVPAWCDRPALRLNGRPLEVRAPRPGAFLRLDRTWADGDTLTLSLPMQVRLRTWIKNRHTVSVDRGPLTYSLQIRENYVRHGGTDRWPAWDIFPASPWNYGLDLPARNPERAFTLVRRPWPADDQPWRWDAAPVQLKTRGRRIPAWTLDEKGLIREVQESPVRSTEPVEEITLIPMGAARLRLSAFPVIGTGPDAHDWAAPPPGRVRASHCWEADSVEAVCDGLEPRHSNDQTIPRFTWWPEKGNLQWIERTFEQPRPVSQVHVYWFDDTGVGGCRVPESWRLLYRDADGRWLQVAPATAFGVDKDRYNIVTFAPVTTDALRLEVKLREGFSGGILEWRVP
jgi:DUF1680 family protein